MFIGRHQECLAAYDRAISLEPTFADIRVNRGTCLAAAGRLDEGIEELKNALQIDPNYPWAHSALSFLYRMKGDHAASVEARARAAELADRLDLANRLREVFRERGWKAYLQELFDNKKPDVLSEVVEILREIPEYKSAAKRNAGPRILFGDPRNRVGRIFVDMTGGTEGPKEMFEKLEAAGVGTIVAMHLGEEHFKNVQKGHINVVIAGHISSDTLGLNLLFDKVAKEDKIEFIGCSGFERINR